MRQLMEDAWEPTNKEEAALCIAMQNILCIDRVGVNDNFFELGGDSLAAMDLVIESGLPGLDASCIFRGCTPAKIAQLYREQMKNGNPHEDDDLNDSAMRSAHKLTTEQLYMLEYQGRTPDSTMHNLFILLLLDKQELDLERLARSVEKAIKNHPALCTLLQYGEDGKLIQKYDPQMSVEVVPEKISANDFEKIKDTLVVPFQIVNSPLFRCRLFETEDDAYLFFDVHHIVFDGTSLRILINSFVNAYIGAPMEKDYYYLVLTKREQEKLTDFYQESRQYFEKTYGKIKWTVCPKIDIKTQENKMGCLSCEEHVSIEDISAAEEKYAVSRNEFYVAATLLAIAINTNKSHVQVSWIYNGRDDTVSSSSVGLLFRDLTVALCLHSCMNLNDIFTEVHRQIQNGIKYSCYPYVESASRGKKGDVTCVLYQSDIFEMSDLSGLRWEKVKIRQNNAASQNVLDIQILDGKDGLEYVFNYDASRYEEETMLEFQNLFMRTVAAIINHAYVDEYLFHQLKAEVSGRKMLFRKSRKRFFGKKK